MKETLMTIQLRARISAGLLRTAFLLATAGAPWLAGCQALAPQERTVGVTLTGLDHLDAHLSIQNFWVNGSAGHQAGKGGGRCAAWPYRTRMTLARP